MANMIVDEMKQYNKSSALPPFRIEIQIPGEMAGYSQDLRRFFDAMVYKLERNLHKGRWESLSVADAFRLMEGEVDELKKEIGGNTTKIVLEAADVANFALMIANIATERGK